MNAQPMIGAGHSLVVSLFFFGVDGRVCVLDVTPPSLSAIMPVMSPSRCQRDPILVAEPDATMSASLRSTRPLVMGSPDHERDVPGHVRSGSAVRRWGPGLVVVQDDVNALALVGSSGAITALTLPRGADGRRTFGEALGNKPLKMDLEAALVLPDGRLVALGSGSTPAREQLVTVDDRGAQVVDGQAFYAALRAERDFSGSELNVEGAVVQSGMVHLFQRGNGAPQGDLRPVDAIGEIPLDAFVGWLDGGSVPVLSRIRPVDLGRVHGVRYGFTDATALPDGRLAFLASAEDSPDSYRDGEVLGTRFGIVDASQARVAVVRAASGEPTELKLEGLDWLGEDDDGAWIFTAVADMDAPDEPAVLAELVVRRARRAY